MGKTELVCMKCGAIFERKYPSIARCPRCGSKELEKGYIEGTAPWPVKKGG